MADPVRRHSTPKTPEQALATLLEGNRRFANGLNCLQARFRTTPEWRANLRNHQAPFAVIVSCSDSRVPAELLFDQGLGDLFIVRNAGAAVGHAALASIEFAVTHLEAPLVMVLTHEGCGAFRAASRILAGAPAPTESLGELVRQIRPALVEVGSCGSEDERCESASRLHARLTAERIAASPVIAPRVHSGAVEVVPAYYRIVEGTVELAEPALARKEEAA